MLLRVPIAKQSAAHVETSKSELNLVLVKTTISTGRQMILLMQNSLYIDALFFFPLEQCASGWLQTGSTCYHFSHEPENWPAAEVYVVILNVSVSQIN